MMRAPAFRQDIAKAKKLTMAPTVAIIRVTAGERQVSCNPRWRSRGQNQVFG